MRLQGCEDLEAALEVPSGSEVASAISNPNAQMALDKWV